MAMMLMRALRIPGAPETSAAVWTGIEEGVAIASVVATVASTAVAASAASQQAAAKQQELNYQAQAAQSQAQAVRGAASYQAYQQQRRAELVMQRAQAVSAAGGGSATDPTAVNITGNIAKQGSYNSLMDLATGEQRARGLETQAGADIYQGQQIAAAVPYEQLNTALKGATSIYTRFGMGGPNPSNPTSSGIGGYSAGGPITYGGMNTPFGNIGGYSIGPYH